MIWEGYGFFNYDENEKVGNFSTIAGIREKLMWFFHKRLRKIILCPREIHLKGMGDDGGEA